MKPSYKHLADDASIIGGLNGCANRLPQTSAPRPAANPLRACFTPFFAMPASRSCSCYSLGDGSFTGTHIHTRGWLSASSTAQEQLRVAKQQRVKQVGCTPCHADGSVFAVALGFTGSLQLQCFPRSLLNALKRSWLSSTFDLC